MSEMMPGREFGEKFDRVYKIIIRVQEGVLDRESGFQYEPLPGMSFECGAYLDQNAAKSAEFRNDIVARTAKAIWDKFGLR